MRSDGRRADRLRPVRLEPGYIVMNAAGGIGTLLAAQQEALAGA